MHSLFLSETEITIVRSLADGDPRKEIAERVGRSRSTIESDLKALRRRYGAKSSPHLVSRMYDEGILIPRRPRRQG